jgi:hypothetical protein
LGIGPNPQSPIPNPHDILLKLNMNKINNYYKIKNNKNNINNNLKLIIHN